MLGSSSNTNIMKAHKRTLGAIAANNRLDSDELLLALWSRSADFDYLKNENSRIYSKDLMFVKEVIISIKEKVEKASKEEVQKNISKEPVHRDYDFSSGEGFNVLILPPPSIPPAPASK